MPKDSRLAVGICGSTPASPGPDFAFWTLGPELPDGNVWLSRRLALEMKVFRVKLATLEAGKAERGVGEARGVIDVAQAENGWQLGGRTEGRFRGMSLPARVDMLNTQVMLRWGFKLENYIWQSLNCERIIWEA